MKKYCIITYGCQMNKNDSERIASFFEENGLEEGEESTADVVIINACSVRQSSINRLQEKIKRIQEREKKPVTVLTGCVLEKDKKKFRPLFDYLLKTEDLPRWNLPFLSGQDKDYFQIPPKRGSINAYISIMTGCNNFCAYCVVPYTKGRETSRPAKEIIKEAHAAIKEGCKEIWLLGQNVNSYKGEIGFPELLRKINNIEGDFWIRFTSSHPKDFSDGIISAMKNCKKVTPYLNLPLQSGDDEILKKMNRSYTSSHYKELIEKIRKSIPQIALSTDIIVGFPGETEKSFNNTVNLFRKISFDMTHIAKYSPRMHTAAYNMKETVSEKEKKRREKILTEILKEDNLEKNKQIVGKTVRVLVKGKNKKGFLNGKTEGYKDVIFKGTNKIIGNFANIKIIDYSSWGLKGKMTRK